MRLILLSGQVRLQETMHILALTLQVGKNMLLGSLSRSLFAYEIIAQNRSLICGGSITIKHSLIFVFHYELKLRVVFFFSI